MQVDRKRVVTVLTTLSVLATLFFTGGTQG